MFPVDPSSHLVVMRGLRSDRHQSSGPDIVEFTALHHSVHPDDKVTRSGPGFPGISSSAHDSECVDYKGIGLTVSGRWLRAYVLVYHRVISNLEHRYNSPFHSMPYAHPLFVTSVCTRDVAGASLQGRSP